MTEKDQPPLEFSWEAITRSFPPITFPGWEGMRRARGE
jgi:hypothetical protein